jgi:hypothetical protein
MGFPLIVLTLIFTLGSCFFWPLVFAVLAPWLLIVLIEAIAKFPRSEWMDAEAYQIVKKYAFFLRAPWPSASIGGAAASLIFISLIPILAGLIKSHAVLVGAGVLMFAIGCHLPRRLNPLLQLREDKRRASALGNEANFLKAQSALVVIADTLEKINPYAAEKMLILEDSGLMDETRQDWIK